MVYALDTGLHHALACGTLCRALSWTNNTSICRIPVTMATERAGLEGLGWDVGPGQGGIMESGALPSQGAGTRWRALECGW